MGIRAWCDIQFSTTEDRDFSKKEERKKERKNAFVHPSREIEFTQERICECVATSAAPPREDL